MRAVVQRVLGASVSIAGATHASISRGMVILVGVEIEDGEQDAAWLSGKLSRLRIFEDDAGKMNRCLADTGGQVLVISQFTLLAQVHHGNRPSFTRAEKPQRARELYERFLVLLGSDLGQAPATGVFAADMQVSLVNDGPVTLILDSRSPPHPSDPTQS